MQTSKQDASPVALGSAARYGLAALSGTLLALPFVFPQLYLLSWIALVPLLWALDQPGTGVWRAYRLGLVSGLMLIVVGTWWTIGFVGRLKGYGFWPSLLVSGGLWFYSAHLIAFFSLLLVVSRHSQIPLLWRVPVLMALMFLVFPLQFQARPGESQSAFLVGIQGASLLGVHGLDWMIGLSNGLLYTLLRRSDLGERAGSALGMLVLALWMGYGVWTLADSDIGREGEHQVRLGLLQPHQPPVLKEPPPEPGFSNGYPLQMELSRQLVEAGADLVVWPEVRFVPYFRYPGLGASYRRQVEDMGVPLLFQAMEKTREGREYNMAVLLDEQGEQAGEYRKVNLVALGETMPGIAGLDGLNQWMEDWLGNFLVEVTAGEESAMFVTGNGLQMIPLICYDVMFPEFVARATRPATGQALMVALSNNAWFGDTVQPRQHLGASVLRAVENRTPLLHVMNNGPSALIGPTGHYEVQTPYGEKAGFLVDASLPDQGAATFYQVVPWLSPWLIYLMGGSLLLMALVRYRSAINRDRRL